MSSHAPSKILEGLYLGNMNDANNERVLRRLKITHVLSICPTRPSVFPGVTYMHVSVKDAPEQNISSWFERCIRFIRTALSGPGAVLVHCHAGISRSATVIIAYLMNSRSMSYPLAVGLVHTVRPTINPNFGFVQQLQDYAETLRSSKTSNLV